MVLGNNISAFLTDVVILYMLNAGLSVREADYVMMNARNLTVAYCRLGICLSSLADGYANVAGFWALNYEGNWLDKDDPQINFTYDGGFRVFTANWGTGLWLMVFFVFFCVLGTLCLEWCLKMHFLHAERAKRGCFIAAIYMAGGASVASWLVALAIPVQMYLDSYLLRNILHKHLIQPMYDPVTDVIEFRTRCTFVVLAAVPRIWFSTAVRF